MPILQASSWRRKARCSGLCWLPCCQSTALDVRQTSGCTHETYGWGQLLCQSYKVCATRAPVHDIVKGMLLPQAHRNLASFFALYAYLSSAALLHVLGVTYRPRSCLTIKAESHMIFA